MYGSRPKGCKAVEHHRIVGRSQADDLHDARDRSDLEEVAKARLVDVGVTLADDADHGTVLAKKVLDQADASSATDVDRHHAGREDDAVSEREERQSLKL
jgi:hypothetical protein